ncbi:MAG: GNAT family N-acetyltransferase [Pseudomonadota bacterium]
MPDTLTRPAALSAPFRLATPADAAALADFITDASEGLAPYFWARTAGAGARAYGEARQAKAAAEWIVAEEAGAAVAGLRGNRQPDAPEPIGPDFEPLFRPLQELENLAPASWYVHVLAARADRRGQGWGSRLLALAEELARAEGCAELSIIVADNNTGAERLYRRTGYVERARRAMVKGDWQSPGTAWILLVKPVPATR